MKRVVVGNEVKNRDGCDLEVRLFLRREQARQDHGSASLIREGVANSPIRKLFCRWRMWYPPRKQQVP